MPTPVDVALGRRPTSRSPTRLTSATSPDERVVEGVEVGSGDSSDLSTSKYASGITTFSASAGNGFGLEYGTGVAYSTVIPLGNVYALLPASPPS